MNSCHVTMKFKNLIKRIIVSYIRGKKKKAACISLKINMIQSNKRDRDETPNLVIEDFHSIKPP